MVGDEVCKSGYITNVTCGVLVQLNWTHSDYNMRYQRRATYASAKQDSGSPVYRTVNGNLKELVGLHWGRADGSAAYSHVGWVLHDLNLLGVVTGY